MTGPRVTVSMPARNAAPWIGAALASVLRQRGVVLDVVVVDDASTDGTAAVVQSLGSPRVRLLRNPRQRGIGHGHNRVLASTDAPFIAHVDADDVVRRDALAQLVAALEREPRAALAHCHYFQIGPQGSVSRAAFRARWRQLRRRGVIDYRQELQHRSAVANHLRTYRRGALVAAGGFDETLPVGVDYDMALRLLEQHEIVCVPRLLYGYRRHGAGVSQTASELENWWRKLRIRRRLRREGRARWLSGHQFDLGWFLHQQGRRLLSGLRSRFA